MRRRRKKKANRGEGEASGWSGLRRWGRTDGGGRRGRGGFMACRGSLPFGVWVCGGLMDCERRREAMKVDVDETRRTN